MAPIVSRYTKTIFTTEFLSFVINIPRDLSRRNSFSDGASRYFLVRAVCMSFLRMFLRVKLRVAMTQAVILKVSPFSWSCFRTRETVLVENNFPLFSPFLLVFLRLPLSPVLFPQRCIYRYIHIHVQ